MGLLLEPFIPLAASGSNAKPKRKVLLATDLTRQIVESMPDDVGSIVVYHPTIFRGLKSITQQDPLQNSILLCASRGISIYSPHTCLDAAEGGIQDWLAQGMGKGKWQPHPQRSRVWELEQPVSLAQAVEKIKARLGMKTDESFSQQPQMEPGVLVLIRLPFFLASTDAIRVQVRPEGDQDDRHVSRIRWLVPIRLKSRLVVDGRAFAS